MLRIGGQRVPPKTLMLVVADAILISGGLWIAVALRPASLWTHFDTNEILVRFGVVVLVSQLALYFNEFYDSPVVARRSEIFVRLLQALGIACLIRTSETAAVSLFAPMCTRATRHCRGPICGLFWKQNLTIS